MKRLLLFAALFLCSLFTYASMTGSGTEDDPYMIYNASDLNEVRDYVGVSNIYFQLANDIDLSAFSTGEGWEPIGTTGAQFKGVFDGNGHTISNLKINRTTDYVGLFGYISGTIKRVRIECDIKGNSFVGGLVGYSSGSISECLVEGNITSTGNYTGGIAGYLNIGLSIGDCVFIGSVKGVINTGGICGWVGCNLSSSYIRRCFTYASIDGRTNVGGICGGINYYGYSTSSSAGTKYSLIENCVAVNTFVKATLSSYGRIVGLMQNASSTTYTSTNPSNCVRNNQSLSSTKVIVNGSETIVSDDDNNGTGIGEALLKKESTYTNLGWDFDNVWAIDEGKNYPHLQCFQSYSKTLDVKFGMLRPGKNTTLSIGLENEEPIIAFEFYMQLPDGISIALDENEELDVTLNSERSNRHILETTDCGNGLYHFMCYSNRNNTLKGNSGELVSVNLICDENVEDGTYQGTIRTIKLSDEEEKRIMLSNCQFNFEVSSIIKGDVNGDEEIDVLDVVMMVSYIMGNNPSNFILEAADHDGDNVVDVIDLAKEVRLIMDNAAANANSAMFESTNDTLSLQTDSEGAISVSINDASRYMASQFVVSLTAGQQLVDVTTDGHHSVTFEPIDNHRYAVMSYSSKNTAFDINEGVFALYVKGNGHVSIEDVTFVSTDEEKVHFTSASPEYTDGISYPILQLTKPTDIYSVSGILQKKNASSTEGLRKGVYIVNGKKQVIR